MGRNTTRLQLFSGQINALQIGLGIAKRFRIIDRRTIHVWSTSRIFGNLVNKTLIVSYIIAGISEIVFHDGFGIGNHILAVLGIIDLATLLHNRIVQQSFGSVTCNNGASVIHKRGETGVFIVGIIS